MSLVKIWGVFGWLLLFVSTAGGKVDFVHEVLPVLKEHCVKCHTNGKYKGGLSMDTREALLESETVVLGKAGESLLIEVLTAEDEDERMPHDADPLGAKEIAILTKWVNEGLAWEKGLTFRKSKWKAPLAPRKVELPKAVMKGENPVDRIARAYFEKNRVQPPAPISDEVFLRRVYLDLIGVLPPVEELNRFLASKDAGKREGAVRDLLGRKVDYADHWMTFWNDLLRNDYAGTGFIDGGRKQVTGWLYDALKNNMRYDQFVKELMSPSPASEGFIKGIKWRGDVNASQVPEIQFAQNVSQVFFGENMKCASCHDSFIDDWKLEDAYGMAAIIAGKPLEMYRCDKPTGKKMDAKFLFDSLGSIDTKASQKKRLERAAELSTSKKNGRLTRTIVNRLWARLMGRGLVEPVDVMSNRPWSEDMLDYLAWDLSENGYNLKRTMFLILNSRTYQSAPVAPPKANKEYIFEGVIAKRMTAEQFIDAVWGITGTEPGKIEAKVNREKGSLRKVRASLVKSTLLMRAMGRPNREQVVTTRPAELTTLQALELNNGAEFVGYLNRGAAKLSSVDGDLVDHVFRTALARSPGAFEREVAEDILGKKPEREQVADFLWMVLMLPEFQMIN